MIPEQTVHLSISIVTYYPDPVQFSVLLKSLGRALSFCSASDNTFSYCITVVDNGNQRAFLESGLDESGLLPYAGIISNSSNLGYGKAHNQASRKIKSTFHLILNPDVILYEDSLHCALKHMQDNPVCVALSPETRGADGKYQYLCKTYPTVADLALRGFSPGPIKKHFDSRLSLYENRKLVHDRKTAPASIISGCFMFCRTEVLQKLGGFNEKFFLYFEDFALSLELGKLGRIDYVPEVKVVHFGGNAGGKGMRHICNFIKSAGIFFSLYGWKWR